MPAPRTLVVFYSRTGTTARVAVQLADALKADLVELRSRTSFSGLFGTLRAIWLARGKKAAPVEKLPVDPADYDLVLVGTPIWASHIAPPVRGFLEANKGKIRDYACFYTCLGTGAPEAGEDMARIMGPSPRAVLDLGRREGEGSVGEARIATYLRELGLVEGSAQNPSP